MRNFSSLSLAFVFAGFIACSGPNDAGSNAETTSDSGSAQTQAGTEATQANIKEEKAGSSQVKSGGQSSPAAKATEVDAGAADASEEAPDGAKAAPAIVQAGGWVKGDTIPSGKAGVPDIQILEVHKNGTGDPCGLGKTATLKYVAMLANGTVIDPGTRPFSFKVGAGRAIKGWDVVVSKMRVGDSFTIMLPMDLAYGKSKGDLKFDMELLAVK